MEMRKLMNICFNIFKILIAIILITSIVMLFCCIWTPEWQIVFDVGSKIVMSALGLAIINLIVALFLLIFEIC